MLVECCFLFSCFFFDWGLPRWIIRLRMAHCFRLVDWPRSALECAADEVLIAIEERFGQRTSMIATFLFPALASFLSHRTQDFIPRQRGRFTIPMLLDYRVFAQGNDRLNWGAARWRGQRVEHLVSIIGPIAAEPIPAVGSTTRSPGFHKYQKLETLP